MKLAAIREDGEGNGKRIKKKAGEKRRRRTRKVTKMGEKAGEEKRTNGK